MGAHGASNLRSLLYFTMKYLWSQKNELKCSDYVIFNKAVGSTSNLGGHNISRALFSSRRKVACVQTLLSRARAPLLCLGSNSQSQVKSARRLEERALSEYKKSISLFFCKILGHVPPVPPAPMTMFFKWT